jgi:hypothetical protein
MKRLLDALCEVVSRMPISELAQVIERDPRSARRWVQVLTGDRRLADLSVVAVLHLARYEMRTYGTTRIADAFHSDAEPASDPGRVTPADLQDFVSHKARGDIRESELVLEVQAVLSDGRIDPHEEDALRRLVELALREASGEVIVLENLRRKLSPPPSPGTARPRGP